MFVVSSILPKNKQKYLTLLLLYLMVLKRVHWVNYLPQWWGKFDDELSWLFTKRFRAFYLICRKEPNLSQYFCYSHSLKMVWGFIFNIWGYIFFDFFISCVVKIHEEIDLIDLCFYSENVPFFRFLAPFTF